MRYVVPSPIRSQMPELELRLFGPPVLRSTDPSGQAPELPAKALALLAFLAVEGGHHGREELATLLWGDSAEEKARASLRQSLRSLRLALGDLIEIDRAGTALRPGLRCDAAAFLTTTSPELVPGSGCEVHRFLEGFSPRHAPVFDEWRSQTRERLLVRYRQMLAELGQQALARREWHRALALGEPWLEREPLSLEAARLVIQARYLSGDAAGALATWDTFSRCYGQELGASPDGDLCQLVDRIRTGALPRQGSDAERPGGDCEVGFEPALVGRAAEWQHLEASWMGVEGGGGRAVILEGEAGSGKTRLMDDFSRWVTARGGRIVSARAWESGQGTRRDSLLELLRAVLRHPGVTGADPVSLGVIARVMPELRRQFPALTPHDGEPGTAVLEEAVAELLLAVADDSPVLVTLDDFQWCDAETTAVVHYLVRRGAHARVLWCIALTPGDASADAPATRVARALRTLPSVAHLRMAPLALEGVWEVIQHLGRLHPEAAARQLATHLHRVTAGNPGYVVELLRSYLAEGWIVPAGGPGEWLVSDGEAGVLQARTVAASVQEAIGQRVARLPEDLQLVLMTLATHDHGLPAGVLSHVHGMSRLRVVSMGDALVDRQLAVEDTGVYRCRHPLIARVVRDSLSEARRRELHRAIALAMLAAAAQGVPASAGDVAHHADLAGDSVLAYDQALMASELARAAGAPAEALDWLDIAARHAGTVEESAAVNRATAELLEAMEESSPRKP